VITELIGCEPEGTVRVDLLAAIAPVITLRVLTVPLLIRLPVNIRVGKGRDLN
jgi:hypothetical protein